MNYILSASYGTSPVHYSNIQYVKARTHRAILRGFAAESATESADYTPELADYTTNSVIVGRLPLSNMFNILNPLESADGSRPTIGVGRRKIGLVGTGLYNRNLVCYSKHKNQHQVAFSPQLLLPPPSVDFFSCLYFLNCTCYIELSSL